MLKVDGRPPRVPFDALVVVSDGHRQVRARAVNISSGGMLLYPVQPLRVGDTVVLQFSLEGYFAEVQADVVRQAREKSQHAVGVKFRATPATLAEGIRRLAPRRQRRDSPDANEVDLVTLYAQALEQIEQEEREERKPRRL
jgi:hypothetical protein